MNTGNKAVYSENNLPTTVAWKIFGELLCIRRKCFVGGAAVQWLRDGAKVVKQLQELTL